MDAATSRSPVARPWSLQPFQIRQTLKTRHLDVGHVGSRHGRRIAKLQLDDGAARLFGKRFRKPKPAGNTAA